MSVLKLLAIDVSLSLLIAGIGVLLVSRVVGAIERWRVAMLARRQNIAKAQNITKIKVHDVPYGLGASFRMLAESNSKPSRESGFAHVYSRSPLTRARVHRKRRFAPGPKTVRSHLMNRFALERETSKPGTRPNIDRKPLPEYAD
jgi:hypothetical protein